MSGRWRLAVEWAEEGLRGKGLSPTVAFGLAAQALVAILLGYPCLRILLGMQVPRERLPILVEIILAWSLLALVAVAGILSKRWWSYFLEAAVVGGVFAASTWNLLAVQEHLDPHTGPSPVAFAVIQLGRITVTLATVAMGLYIVWACVKAGGTARREKSRSSGQNLRAP